MIVYYIKFIVKFVLSAMFLITSVCSADILWFGTPIVYEGEDIIISNSDVEVHSLAIQPMPIQVISPWDSNLFWSASSRISINGESLGEFPKSKFHLNLKFLQNYEPLDNDLFFLITPHIVVKLIYNCLNYRFLHI